MDESCSRRDIIFPTALVISSIGLIITIVVYVGLPELRNTPGKILLSMSAALLVAYTTLTTVQILGGRLKLPDCVCYATGWS